jgi:hypothetical protein
MTRLRSPLWREYLLWIKGYSGGDFGDDQAPVFSLSRIFIGLQATAAYMYDQAPVEFRESAQWAQNGLFRGLSHFLTPPRPPFCTFTGLFFTFRFFGEVIFGRVWLIRGYFYSTAKLGGWRFFVAPNFDHLDRILFLHIFSEGAVQATAAYMYDQAPVTSSARSSTHRRLTWLFCTSRCEQAHGATRVFIYLEGGHLSEVQISCVALDVT